LRGRVILAILLAVPCGGACVSQGTKFELRKIVGLSVEDGDVALQGDTISVFSKGDIVIRDQTGNNWVTQEKISDGVSVRIKGSEWERAAKNLDLSIAHRPGLCDPFDQIDLPPKQGKLRSALPTGAKVKLVQEFQDYSFVVFSTSTGQQFYQVRVALLQPAPDHGYRLIKTDTATETGIFCGMQGVDHDHGVVFTDEPAGSSDFLGVYVYEVTH
jgi:hypothetical protein